MTSEGEIDLSVVKTDSALLGSSHEVEPVAQANTSDPSSSPTKTPAPRLAVITGMLMEKNKSNPEESDQDSMFESDIARGFNPTSFSRFNKPGKRPVPFSTKSAADRGDSSSTSVITDADIRKFVFLHARGKRLLNGLKVHSLNKQTFLSSFSVGIVLGIFVALICKLISDFVFTWNAGISRS